MRQPRVNDRQEGQRFASAILPPYLWRVASIKNLIPALCLKGISTGEMVRLGGDRPCLLVLVGSFPDGTKEVAMVYDGERKRRLSCR